MSKMMIKKIKNMKMQSFAYEMKINDEEIIWTLRFNF